MRAAGILFAFCGCTGGCSGAGEITIPTDSGTPTPTAPAACETATPSLAMGTGEHAYEPLAEGDGVTMVNGPQGGWHLWTSGQVTGLGPQVQVTGRVVVTRNGERIGGDDPPVAIDLSDPAMGTWDAAACAGSFAGLLTYLTDFVPPPGKSNLDVICNLEGEELEFTVEVADLATGDVASDVRLVRARLDPLNEPYCSGN